MALLYLRRIQWTLLLVFFQQTFYLAPQFRK
jgi:hypothetical protein